MLKINLTYIYCILSLDLWCAQPTSSGLWWVVYTYEVLEGTNVLTRNCERVLWTVEFHICMVCIASKALYAPVRICISTSIFLDLFFNIFVFISTLLLHVQNYKWKLINQGTHPPNLPKDLEPPPFAFAKRGPMAIPRQQHKQHIPSSAENLGHGWELNTPQLPPTHTHTYTQKGVIGKILPGWQVKKKRNP